MTLKTFVYYHKNWDINLYLYETGQNNKLWETNEVQDFFNFAGEDCFDKIYDLPINVKSWVLPSELKEKYGEITSSQASNFFKFKLLGEEKFSVYADLDIIFVNNVDLLIEDIVNSGSTNAICFHKYFSIGFLFSLEKDEMFGNIYKKMVATFSPEKYQGSWFHILSKHKSLDSLNNMFGGKSYNLDMDLFYKLDSVNVNKIWENKEAISNNQLGVHWYAGHPLSQEWNNKLSSANWHEYDNYLISAINKSESKV